MLMKDKPKTCLKLFERQPPAKKQKSAYPVELTTAWLALHVTSTTSGLGGTLW